METTAADILARIANDLAAGRTVCAAPSLEHRGACRLDSSVGPRGSARGPRSE